MNIPYSRVNIGELERKHLNEVLDSGWLTTASKTLEFEKRFASYIGVKYACAVNSCTSALHLALEAIGLEKNEKVFIPDMTFTATAEVVRYFGADIVPLDVEYGTSLITPAILMKAINENQDVRYLIVVHYGGQAAEMTEILRICSEFGIKVIEDAAHAFPSKCNGSFVGTLSLVTCFSFYANKTITTGEGGMIVTNNDDIYKRIKTMRLHGINRDVWNRFNSRVPSWEYDVIAAGYKYNLSDLASSIGLGQLERAEEFRKRRQEIAELYFSELNNVKSIDLPKIRVSNDEHAWHLYTIILNEFSDIKRSDFIEHLSEYGIGTSVHYKPIHHLSFYRDRYNLNSLDFPNSEKIWRGTVSLPIYFGLGDDEVLFICDKIKKILNFER